MADSPYYVVINPPGDIVCRFQQYLFNQPFHILTQACKQVYTFYLVHIKKQQAYARFTLFRQGEKGISPCRGTFGSVEMNPLLPVDFLDQFIQYIDTFATAEGIRTVEIKSYPFGYHPEVSATLTSSLLRQQYQIIHSELNYHIPVSQQTLESRLHLSEQRRLKKCIAAGFSFGIETAPDFTAIYQMIVAGRQRKKLPVSMSFTDFRQLFETFPGIYKIFTVKDQSTVAAAAVAVQINEQILYYFLPAHHPEYDKFSPMVLLINGLYTYCQQKGFLLFDLGISTDKGVPNYGLMRFKQNLGALPSLKLSFMKTLIK